MSKKDELTEELLENLINIATYMQQEKRETKIKENTYNDSEDAFVSLPSWLKQIDRGAFQNSAIRAIDIPNSVEMIGNNAFDGCENLKSITLPADLQSLGIGAFCQCKNLEIVDLPDSLEKINRSTFARCEALKFVKLPKSLRIIEARAFQECPNLKRLEIPSEIRYIDNTAFEGTDVSLIFKSEQNSNLSLAKVKNVLFDSTFRYNVFGDEIRVFDLNRKEEIEK